MVAVQIFLASSSRERKLLVIQVNFLIWFFKTNYALKKYLLIWNQGGCPDELSLSNETGLFPYNNFLFFVILSQLSSCYIIIMMF